jgi:integrase
MKSQSANKISVFSLGIPDLPEFASTLTGVRFDPRSAIWDYYDGLDHVKMDFQCFEKFLCANLIQSFKAVLMHATEELAPNSILSCFVSMKVFAESAGATSMRQHISVADVKSFWYESDINIHYKIWLRSVIDKWTHHRYDGIDDGVVTFLDKQEGRVDVSGQSVRTWDPISGPLTDNEFKSFYESLTDFYARKLISTELFLITWLVTSLGLRPRQIALLKICDLSRKSEAGIVSYSLSIPRIKQRGQRPRDEIYEWPIINEIGELFYNHCKSQMLKHEADILIVKFAPLFSTASRNMKRREFEEQNHFISNDERTPSLEDSCGNSLTLHMSVSVIQDRLRSVFCQLDVISERVGSDIVLGPRRLRKTYGTRLAADNVPAPMIAKMLGHRDIKSSEPYIAATSQLQNRLDKALAFELAPLAQAFRGELRSKFNKVNETGAVIRDLRVVPSGEELGKCGKNGYCGHLAPIACYTCKKFRPWVDAPHEAIFNFLWEKREKRRIETQADSHMTMLHDRTLLAVAEVVLRCQHEKTT